LQEVVRIGSVDGEIILNRVRDLDVGPNGDVYIAQGDDQRITVFGPDGEPKASIGRAGGGPGEFRAAPTRVTWRGDTLIATERFATHFFEATGREARRVQFQVRIPSESSTFINGTPLVDGTFLGTRYLNPPVRVFVTAENIPLRRFSASGEVVGTIAHVNHSMPAVGNERFRREFENRWLHHPLGWFAHDSWLPVVVTEDEAAVVFVGDVRDEPPASFDLLQITANGDTLFKRSVAYEPIEIGAAERERIRDAFADQFVGVEAGTAASGRAAREHEAARSALELPASYPPVRRIVAGGDGSIWLLRESSPRPYDLWEVYGEDGLLEASVRIDAGRTDVWPWAPRLTILYATRDVVWGLTTDELDVPYIHRFRVEHMCERNARPGP
jgi:hypothetical protein